MPACVSEEALLFAADFDGTEFITGEIPAGGTNVDGAYALGIGVELGEEAAERFLAEGGHRHRSPLEIVRSLRPDLDTTKLHSYTRAITENRLDVLCGQIGLILPDGAKWPRPTAGFPEFWNDLHEAREQARPIFTAVLSAGHTRFIARTHEVHDLPPPDVIISEEVLDNMRLTYPLDRRVKPARLLMDLAIGASQQYFEALDVGARNHEIQRVYVGDSEEKDKALAEGTGAGFVLIHTDDAADDWQQVRQLVGLDVPVPRKGARRGKK